MIDREHIERLLKLNGLEETAADEEIKSILLSARYKEHEVDAALMVLRENKDTNRKKIDGLHKIFRTDDLLDSKEISDLLGIDINLEDRVVAGSSAREMPMLGQVLLSIVAVLVALTALILYMYIEDIGLFHHTSAYTFG